MTLGAEGGTLAAVIDRQRLDAAAGVFGVSPVCSACRCSAGRSQAMAQSAAIATIASLMNCLSHCDARNARSADAHALNSRSRNRRAMRGRRHLAAEAARNGLLQCWARQSPSWRSRQSGTSRQVPTR